MDESDESPAIAYAAALRKVVDGFRATGGTQKEVAESLHVSESSLSRYLSASRVAPREVLHALQEFLKARGLPLAPEACEELDALCERAHLASGSATIQLAHLQRELASLRAEQEQAQEIAESRLSGLEAQARSLGQQLEEALAAAEAAEGERQILQDRVAEQDESLRHAQEYTHEIETELHKQKEEARLLLVEVDKLREQNRRLVDEQPGGISGVSTQATNLAAVGRTHHARAQETPEPLTTNPPGQEETDLDAEEAELRRIMDGYMGRRRKAKREAPVRDTLGVLVLIAVIGALGLVFSGGLQATPALPSGRSP